MTGTIGGSSKANRAPKSIEEQTAGTIAALEAQEYHVTGRDGAHVLAHGRSAHALRADRRVAPPRLTGEAVFHVPSFLGQGCKYFSCWAQNTCLQLAPLIIEQGDHSQVAVLLDAQEVHVQGEDLNQKVLPR
jgi:hypothetical protein